MANKDFHLYSAIESGDIETLVAAQVDKEELKSGF